MPKLLYVAFFVVAFAVVIVFRRQVQGIPGFLRRQWQDMLARREQKRLETKRYHEQLEKEQKGREERMRVHEQEMAQAWGEKVASIISEHKEALRYEKSRYESVDAYGNVDDSAWYDTTKLSMVLGIMNGYNDISMLNASINAGHADCGFLYFWRYVILPCFGSLENFIDGWQAAQRVYPGFSDSNWVQYICEAIDQGMNYQAPEDPALSDDQTVATGLEYEQYCKQILENMSWSVLATPASGDQGVDLIAIHPSGFRVCIQCKYSSNPVGNSAVQEVVAGKAHYSGTHAVVVSHSGFTKSAIDLARSNNVVLIGTDELQNLLDKITRS